MNKINSKVVTKQVQSDILDYFDKDNYRCNNIKSNLQALKSQIDSMNYNQDTIYNIGKKLVEGGTFLVSYYEVNEYLKDLELIKSIDTNTGQDIKNWNRYIHLLAVNIEKLYNKEVDKSGILNLEIERVNNSINGNPRYKILSFDDTELMNYLIKKGDFRELKKGLFTKSDACFGYGIENKQGVQMHGITVLSTRIY